MAVKSLAVTLSYVHAGLGCISSISLLKLNNTQVFSLGCFQKRWRRERPYHGSYPDGVMEPTTDKTELAEMEESDPRHFTQIKALRTDEYIACFQDPVIEKLIRRMLNKKGNKNNFRKIETREIMYNCMEFIKNTQLEKYYKASTQEEKDAIETNPYKIIYGAIENSKPLLNLTELRKGAVMYRVPTPVNDEQQFMFAIKWLVQAGRRDTYWEDEFTAQRFANEFINAFYNTGKVVKQKQELHKEAETNKAYAHFRWGKS